MNLTLKNKLFRRSCFWALFLVSVVLACRAQTAPQELPAYKYGARFNAFAGADITDGFDASAMYWNPASISYLDSRSVLWDYLQDWGGNSKSELFAAPLYQGQIMSAAVGGTMGVVNFSSVPNGMSRFSQYGIDLATGIKLDPTFSVGVRGIMNYGNLGATRLVTLSSSVGILYTPGPDISYGMVYDGIGRSMGYAVDSGASSLEQTNLPHTLSLGLVMHFPSSPSERVVNIALSNDKTFGEKGIRYNGGIEWCVTRFFFTRASYIISPTIQGAIFGAGINAGMLRMDFTVSPYTMMQRFQEFTLSVPL